MPDRIRLSIGAAMAACLVLGAVGCTSPPDPWESGKSPRVLASFPPLYCFVANVAGEEGTVKSLLVTTGPHDYQPTALDTLKLRGADLFFINGLGLDEHFAEKLRNNSGNSRLELIEIGEKIEDSLRIRSRKGDGGKTGEGHAHVHGEFDPHVWLGIPEAIIMVEAIRDQLKTTDPKHSQQYDKNAAAYVAKLQRLHEEGKALLKNVKPADRKMISFHDSLAYFARSFDLTVAGTIQKTPGDAPTASQLDALIDSCEKQKVRLIAREPQYSAEAARPLLAELERKGISGVKLVEIDPLETAPPSFDKEYYETKMRENIQNLADALK